MAEQGLKSKATAPSGPAFTYLVDPSPQLELHCGY